MTASYSQYESRIFVASSSKTSLLVILFELKKSIHKIFTFLTYYLHKGKYIMTTPINSTPVACVHNGLPDTSFSDIIEHNRSQIA